MKGMLLAVNPWNYVLIAVVVLLLIALPMLMNARNKKETQKVQEQTNNLKVGDKVLTTSGVYGTITEIKFDESKKTVVLETGGKVKSYLTVDAYAIYTVFKSDAELRREAEQKAEAEQKKSEPKADEKAVEAEQNEKQNSQNTETSQKSAQKKTTAKKNSNSTKKTSKK